MEIPKRLQNNFHLRIGLDEGVCRVFKGLKTNHPSRCPCRELSFFDLDSCGIQGIRDCPIENPSPIQPFVLLELQELI